MERTLTDSADILQALLRSAARKNPEFKLPFEGGEITINELLRDIQAGTNAATRLVMDFRVYARTSLGASTDELAVPTEDGERVIQRFEWIQTAAKDAVCATDFFKRIMAPAEQVTWRETLEGTDPDVLVASSQKPSTLFDAPQAPERSFPPVVRTTPPPVRIEERPARTGDEAVPRDEEGNRLDRPPVRSFPPVKKK